MAEFQRPARRRSDWSGERPIESGDVGSAVGAERGLGLADHVPPPSPEATRSLNAMWFGEDDGAQSRQSTSSSHPDDKAHIAASLEVVKSRIDLFGKIAHDELDTLKTHIGRKDEPDWFGHLLEGLLEVALGGGAAAAGAFLAHRFAASSGRAGIAFVEGLF